MQRPHHNQGSALAKLLLAATALCTALAAAQVTKNALATDNLPRFEVVSIKAHPHGYWPTFEDRRLTPDGFIWKNTIAQGLMVYAFDLRDPKLKDRERLIPGGEKWMFWDWFDIEARMSEANMEDLRKLSSPERELYERQLLQSVLVDRFKLKFHYADRNIPGYELVLAKSGPRNLKPEPDSVEALPIPHDLDHICYQAAPMSMFVDFLEGLESAPIEDKTELKGKYDLCIEFARDPGERLLPNMSLPASNDAEPSIFTALQEQLGLKLVRAQVPTREIVIDHIEKPSPN